MDVKTKLGVVCGLSLLAAVARAVTVSTGSFVANPGAVVTVPVAIDDVKGLSYASVRLAYDPQVLVPLKTAEGSLRTVFDADFVTVGNLSEGWIAVSAFGRTNAAASVSGTVADVTFAVRAGTAGLYSDVTVTKVELGDTSGLRDATADRTVAAASGMVRVMGAGADVARLERAQTVVADTTLAAWTLTAGDALQASDAQTPVTVTGGVSAPGAIPVAAPANGWATGRYELLRTPTAGLAFALNGLDGATATLGSAAADGWVVYYADVAVAGETPVGVAAGVAETLDAGTCNRIRANLSKALAADAAAQTALAAAKSIEVTGPDGSIALVAELGIAPAFGGVDVAGVAHVTYAMPTVRITSFDPATGRLGIKVEPGAGNAIVDELATGYVHVYGTARLGEAMRYISQVGFDLTPYLKAETKGEATLQIALGAHAFFKIRIEAAAKCDGGAE